MNIEHLQYIDGEYKIVQRPHGWRLWLRRVLGYGALVVVVFVAWLMSGW